VLIALIGFFGVIFAVNGYFIYSALKTHSGVVAIEPYRKGLAYNDRIAAEERQSRLGWNGTLDVERNGTIALTIADRDGHAVSGQVVTATIGRPVNGKDDLGVSLVEVEPGRYAAVVGALASGAWILSAEVAEARNATQPSYRLRRRVWLKP